MTRRWLALLALLALLLAQLACSAGGDNGEAPLYDATSDHHYCAAGRTMTPQDNGTSWCY